MKTPGLCDDALCLSNLHGFVQMDKQINNSASNLLKSHTTYEFYIRADKEPCQKGLIYNFKMILETHCTHFSMFMLLMLILDLHSY